MNINQKLKKIYDEKWFNLHESGKNIAGPTPTNPLLLCFDETSFSQAEKKIVICGQETLGWGHLGGSTVDSCMEDYTRFFIKKGFYPGVGVSAFWKAFRFFESELTKTFEGKNLQFIWQNLAKLGRADGEAGVTNEIREMERKEFPVFSEEIEIIKPDMVVFLTGPDRDHDIRFHYPDAQFSQAGDCQNIRERAWVTAERLPTATLRLYHPNYFGAWTKNYKNDAITLLNTKA